MQEPSVVQHEQAAWTGAICQETAALREQAYRRDLRAVVLTGSLARDEGTFTAEGRGIRLLGDAELFMIFRDSAGLPPARDIETSCRQIEATLAARGLTCHVALSPVHARYLERLPPRILSYELKECGRVVWGEPGVLSLIRGFSPADILREDAWRLLANRMVEQFDAAAELMDCASSLSSGVYYRTIKLYLDMATSLLVFLGAYRPTYRERAESLRAVAAGQRVRANSLPFDLDAFVERVEASTALKLHGFAHGQDAVAYGAAAPSFSFWKDAVEYAHRLWRWELAQLIERDDEPSDSVLIRKWMSRQSLAARLRGWAHVARQCGGYRSWRMWPRWARCCWRSSPRYGIYAAASELFFSLPMRLEGGGPVAQGDVICEKFSSYLPISISRGGNDLGWMHAAAEIASSYHRFLEGTCA